MSIRNSLIVCCVLLLHLFILFVSGCRREVDIPLIVDFEYEIADSNYNAPVSIGFTNKTTGALFYKWTFPDGNIKESNSRNPGYVIFEKPGTLTIRLEAWNDFARSEKLIKIEIDTVPLANFEAIPYINNYTPVEWGFNFTGKGATRYSWYFENGSPDNSFEKNPPKINYILPGTYKVKLVISNDRGRTDSISKYITVKPALDASFEISPSYEDDDFEAPLTAKLDNHTLNATSHRWEANGGIISNPADSLPSILFQNAGTYTITYTASNLKQTQVVTRTITVKPNTRLRYFKDVHLGINTAHKETGSFFSTYLRKVIQQDSVSALNGPYIDICYFGLSSSFSFNKFLSPTDVQNWTFKAIPGAKSTVIINKQEACNCGVNLSPVQFDNITDGSAFDNLPVNETATGLGEFDNTLIPRVVVFKNANGKKGAIKIKEFVSNGEGSYIVCDIKIQKD